MKYMIINYIQLVIKATPRNSHSSALPLPNCLKALGACKPVWKCLEAFTVSSAPIKRQSNGPAKGP